MKSSAPIVTNKTDASQKDSINLKGTAIFAGIVLALMILALLTIKLLMSGLDHSKENNLNTQTAGHTAANRPYFPLPREQVDPLIDLNTLRQNEGGQLNSYGWIHRKAGVVRVPIARAMELILQRGLPTRTNSSDATIGVSSLELQQRRASETNSATEATQ